MNFLNSKMAKIEIFFLLNNRLLAPAESEILQPADICARSDTLRTRIHIPIDLNITLGKVYRKPIPVSDKDNW